jgi:imidazolonepropionase-like amidohydrolase
MGATQIKAMAGGGVSSPYDPLDTTQFTFEEMKAIVDVAKTWNTYAAVHTFTDASTQQAIRAGVLSIEHGHLLSEETLKMMSQKSLWLCIQPILDDEEAIPFPDPASKAKFVKVTEGTDRVYKLAKKHKVKIAFGTDTLFDPELAKKQGKQLAKLSRWFTSYEVLKMATHDNAELLKLCGPRDPYPGKLGIIEEGALADMIIVNGNPIENLDLVADSEKNFALIMKDGKIYKNTIKS